MVDWSDGPLLSIVLPMVDNHRKPSIVTQWLGDPKTVRKPSNTMVAPQKVNEKIVRVDPEKNQNVKKYYFLLSFVYTPRVYGKLPNLPNMASVSQNNHDGK